MFDARPVPSPVDILRALGYRVNVNTLDYGWIQMIPYAIECRGGGRTRELLVCYTNWTAVDFQFYPLSKITEITFP